MTLCSGRGGPVLRRTQALEGHSHKAYGATRRPLNFKGLEFSGIAVFGMPWALILVRRDRRPATE